MKLLAQVGRQRRSIYDYIASSNKVSWKTVWDEMAHGGEMSEFAAEVGRRRGRKEFEKRAVANVKDKHKREVAVADARAMAKNTFGSNHIVK
jgi:hypothetical protein